MEYRAALVAGLTFFALSGPAVAGCKFSWHHYGEDSVYQKIAAQLGSKVTDEFCPFAKDYEIVLQTNAYSMRNMCAGHALASIRKANTNTQQTQTFSALSTDTNCRTIGGAESLAVRAGLSAVEDLMSKLGDYKVNQ